MKGMIKRVVICLAAAAIVAIGFGANDVLAKKGKVTHNVTFIYGMNTVTVPVVHGKDAPVPTDTAVPGFQFAYWVGDSTKVTEDRVILGAYTKIPQLAPSWTTSNISTGNALWTKKASDAKTGPWPAWWDTIRMVKGEPGKTCAVHWYNGWNGELWKTDLVPYGSSLATPPDPCIAGYEFAGWVGDWTNVTEDRAIMATYFVNHKIKFIDSMDPDDDYIDIKSVRDGEGAWVDPPHHDGYKFIGYFTSDGDEYEGGGVHHDLNVWAKYKEDND